MEYAQPGEPLKFKSSELSAQERRTLHIFCNKNGLEHRSEGRKDNRRLIIIKPKFQQIESNQS